MHMKCIRDCTKAIFGILKLDRDPISQGQPENENFCHQHIPGNGSFDLMGHKP